MWPLAPKGRKSIETLPGVPGQPFGVVKSLGARGPYPHFVSDPQQMNLAWEHCVEGGPPVCLVVGVGWGSAATADSELQGAFQKILLHTSSKKIHECGGREDMKWSHLRF